MDAVVHFEIPAENYERAKKFYMDLFGWQIAEYPGAPTVYGMATTTSTDPNTHMPTVPGEINGAVMAKQDPKQVTTITIAVSSIDDYLKKIEAAGGKMTMAKRAVGEMGFQAQFLDPEGNVVGLWENAK